MKREGIISFRQARRAECFEVTGVVQGVGFRPFVWRRATQLGLCGQIRNLGDRVEILAAGQESALNHLEKALQIGPPHARVDCVIRKEIPDKGWHDFTIVESDWGAVESGMVVDLATCPACLAESRAITGRRAGYALTNCTHCGPRFSIVTGFPYDRAQTTMAPFGMCLACRAEYTNPADRRFHAQAIACPACGPLLTYLDQDGQNFTQEKALSYAAQRLRAGGVLAMKGIGGYHLACLATQADSIQQLRVIKHRPFQPLAVMMRDVAMVAHYCRMNEAEQNLLNSAAAPIVLLQPLKHNILPNNLAPGVARWGVMLPYTPLHALLLEAVGAPLVMSSGNVSGSPQIIDDAEALKLLAPRGEGCLMHNRKIARRLDDSLVHYVAGQRMTVRRGRGLVPEWFCLPQGLENAPSVLAVGADTKAAFCLTRGGKALLSQHLGNLNDVAGKEGFLTALRDYQTLFQYNNPCILAHDAHPDYVSTRLAQELAQEWGGHLQPIWHHHAHIVACMAEHGFDILTSSINQKRDHQHRVG
ncbi:MAG: carbamoyltransferase HypF, partial [Acetobacter sp.]|nr:carbamoyltransferase HypF [Acetobacter sp.]